MVLVLMVSISSLAIADEAEDDPGEELGGENQEGQNDTQEPEENETEEPEGNETENPTGNETEGPVDNETQKEMEVMHYSLGAEIRLLQLEKAITKNLLQGEMAVDVLKGLDYNTTDLEAILAELRLILDEVKAADAQANDSEEVFVGLKADAMNLTKQFRDAIRELVPGGQYKQVREQIRNATSDELQNYSKQIRNRIKQFNVNQIYRLYGIIGEGNNSLVNEYMNGTCNLSQVKLQLNKMVNMKINEKRDEIFSTMKKEKLQNKDQTNSKAANISKNFEQKQLERLQERLEQANNSGNEKLVEMIQNRIANTENSSNGQQNGNSAGENGSGKGKGKGQ